MVLKKSIKQNLILKDLDINNVFVGDDGLLYAKPQVSQEEVVLTATANVPVEEVGLPKNALVFLNNKEETPTIEIVKEKSPSKRKRKSKE